MSDRFSKKKVPEGWTWLSNSRKFHYFIRETGRSLCGRWALLKMPDELDADCVRHLVDDCAGCTTALRKRKKQ